MKYKIKAIIFSLALFYLWGCIPTNHTVSQSLEIPMHWRLKTNEASTLCNLNWWTQFKDPILNELIVHALQNNENLHEAISRVYEYYALLGITSADLYPLVTGNFNYTRRQSSLATAQPIPPGISRINNNYRAFLRLNWELDFWGRISSATEAARADVLAQVEARRAVVITVVTNVARAYINLLAMDVQYEISKKTLESRENSLRLARDRFKLGETSLIEVTQAESEVETAKIRILQLEREIFKQEDLISILVGENPNAIIRGRPLDSLVYPEFIPTGIPSELLIRRPDILEAENKLLATNARIAEARALFFPQFTLTAEYGSESAQLKNFLTSPAEFWDYGINVVQTIFDAGKISYEVKAAQARRAEAYYAYRQVILNAFREVNDALISILKNHALVIEHKKQVAVLTEYRNLARLQYAEGEIDYLNVLDAERSLFDAELVLAQAEADRFNVIIDLYGALGGGWVEEADAMSLCSFEY